MQMHEHTPLVRPNDNLLKSNQYYAWMMVVFNGRSILPKGSRALRNVGLGYLGM